MTFRNDIGGMNALLHRLEALLGAARAVIDRCPVPTDAAPSQAIFPLFVIHPDHLDGWKERVDGEIWWRLSLFSTPIVLSDPEQTIQSQPYALDAKELAAFRTGAPILKMPIPVATRDRLPQGGRRKDAIEIALRKGLAFEVWRREIELRGIEALQAKRAGRVVDPMRTTALPTLACLVWVEGFPTKRRTAGDSGGDASAEQDARLETFAALHDEGRKLAADRVADADRPRHVRDAIFADILRRDAPGLTSEDFEAAATEAAWPVALLMRAVTKATRAAEQKHDLSTRVRSVLSGIDGRRRGPHDPTKIETMTKRDHSVIADSSFTARELAEIACLCDIDPNLLSASHMLATPEFGIARKLGRLGRGADVVFSAGEVQVLKRFVFPAEQGGASSMFAEVHALLAEYAFEIMPAEAWRDRVAAT